MLLVLVLACGWGALAAAPVYGIANRVEASARVRALRPVRPRRSTARVLLLIRESVVARVWTGLWRARGIRRADEAVRRELPVAVDLAAVAVGAGCTPWQAAGLAAQYSPPPVAEPLAVALRAASLGASFETALADASAATPAIAPLADALRIGARTGTPIAPVLARVARDVRADTRRRAEARARTVPVRLLFPLVFCTLPAFVLLTVAPVVLDGFRL